MHKRFIATRRLRVAGAIGVLALAAAGCGSSNSNSSSSSSSSGGSTSSSGSATLRSTPTSKVPMGGSVTQVVAGKMPIDMAKYCGTKPWTLGDIDGVGGIPWRIETEALVTDLAKECPDNTGVKYFNANLSPQAFNSTISSWAAQRYGVVVAFDDFGQGVVPAFTAAQRQGTKIVTDNAIPGNATIPADVTAAVEPNFKTGAAEWAQFLKAATHGKGQVVLVGGPAGNLFDGPATTDLTQALSGTGLTMAESQPQYANWDLATTQKVMSALLAKNPNINGVVLTYMATAPGIIRAYQAAGKALPAIAGQSSSNQVVCDAHKIKGLQVFSLDNSAAQAAIALAKGVAAYEGVSAPELGPTNAPTISAYAKYIDTEGGIVPPCNSSLPPGADLSTPLPEATIASLLK